MRLGVIGLLVLMVASCVREVEPSVRPSRALVEIDSLMWSRPDSAFAMLLEFADSPVADSLDAFNGHYCQLLVSELLYKNDYEQTNREELLEAVDYFDSIGDAFLDARAHYIKGVGFYERDSVVEACEEYLKALEVMEDHYDEKELVGVKAKFMTFIYNRLGDMFEEQLLVEPAIEFYKQALSYCRREPTTEYGIPILLYRLGIQYDISGQRDSAAYYYDESLANMPDFDNPHYRDLMVNRNLFAYYNSDFDSDSLINSLEELVKLSADEGEKTTRLLTLGIILFEEKKYDSSRVYLETVFEQQEDITSKIMAAEHLCNIFQATGDSLNAQKYASFLVGCTMSEIEKKTYVSRVNEMLEDYLNRKQTRQDEIERDKEVRRVKGITIPIVVMFVLAIVFVLKHRSKKLFKEQQKETAIIIKEIEEQHDAELRLQEAKAKKELDERDKRHSEAIEAERRSHFIEKAAILGRLKRKSQEVRDLKGQIRRQDDSSVKVETAASFNEEPVCRLIMERVEKGRFKTTIAYKFYKDFALDRQQLLELRLAVDHHFRKFTTYLKTAYPKLTNSDIDYCCLYLLGLNDADVSALMQRTYNTVFERSSKIRKIFGNEDPLPVTLTGMVNDLYSSDKEDVNQKP